MSSHDNLLPQIAVGAPSERRRIAVGAPRPSRRAAVVAERRGRRERRVGYGAMSRMRLSTMC